MRPFIVAVLVLCACSIGRGATYTVENTNNGGAGSLRRAINQANNHSGKDTIRFAGALAGQWIKLSTPLPYLADAGTTINGDINGDGAPDIALNGGSLTSPASGLIIVGNGCIVRGLAIIKFPDYGVFLAGASHCRIHSCHLGANLAGTKRLENEEAQIALSGANYNRIGGTTVARRNVIAITPSIESSKAGPMEEPHWGIRLVNSQHNTIAGNYIGLKRDGTSTLGTAGIGIQMEHSDYGLSLSGEVGAGGPPIAPCDENTIGGTRTADRNVIGGCDTGIIVREAHDNVIQGNYFGLTSNGNRAALISDECILVDQGSTGNVLGGKSAAARNVFGRGEEGILFDGMGTAGNKVQGSYFGLNAAGTKQFQMTLAVHIRSSAGAQTIGGGTARAGNYFAPWGQSTCIVVSIGSGQRTLVRNNVFGVRPDGRKAAMCETGINSYSRMTVTDNLLANHTFYGVRLFSTPVSTQVLRNTFRNCGAAVVLRENARCVLGNLNNTSTGDDGGNNFRPSNTWHIRNETPNVVKAEGNRFATTSRSEINAKIWDKRDQPGLGRVDFDPLMGGVSPTGTVLAVTGLAAAPTTAGAQITFALSSAAQVQARILNIAGRPVKTLCRAKDCEAGTNTLLWNAQSDNGLQAPNGMYLVEVMAKAGDGGQVRALGQVSVSK